MRRFFLFLAVFFSLSFSFSFSSQDIEEFTLENGLKCFVLTDFSCATVRMELVIKAGYSYQNERTAGFFPLYAHMLDADITADTVRIEKKSSPNEFLKILGELKNALLPLTVSDNVLEKEFKAMKETVYEYSSSTSGFINTAIDARIFTNEPWRTESGVYPALFSKNNIAQVRSVLDSIQNNYYNPENACLFVSGNISQSKARKLISETFGNLSRGKTASLKKLPPLNEKKVSEGEVPDVKKFVLVDDEFSPEITQVVLQYTDLDEKKCDVLSRVFNESSSAFKKNILLEEKDLGLIAEDYINVSSSITKFSSRLIVQSILGTSKKNPVYQTELFLDKCRNFKPEKLKSTSSRIKKEISKEFTHIKDSSSSLMSLFASWKLLNEDKEKEVFFDNFAIYENLDEETELEFSKEFENASPVYFVLTSPLVYEKNKKEFTKKGYEKITRKNGSWYSMSLYSQVIKGDSKQKIDEEKEKLEEDQSFIYRNFIDSAKKSVTTLKLRNGIPVTLKKSAESETACFSILIDGGNLEFVKQRPYLTNVLVNCFCDNINRELYLRQYSGALRGIYKISSVTKNTYSRLDISCQVEDLAAVLESAGKALVYSDITPAMADRLVYNERTAHRIKIGASDYQILCSAVADIFKKSDLKKIYSGEDEILEDIQFSEIAQAYPVLLDASRYNLIISGSEVQNSAILSVLNRTFGVLENMGFEKSGGKTEIENSLKPSVEVGEKLVKKVPVRHLFFTDISADKAGPRPLVLVPTKKFFDPVLYCFMDNFSDLKERTLFHALLLELSSRLQKEVPFQNKVKISTSEIDFPLSVITVTGVERTSVIDQTFRRVYSKLLSELEDNSSAPEMINEDGDISREGRSQILLDLENQWLTYFLKDTGTNAEDARLLADGIVFGNKNLYLDGYDIVVQSSLEDYVSVLKKCFSELPDIRFYSKDSR